MKRLSFLVYRRIQLNLDESIFTAIEERFRQMIPVFDKKLNSGLVHAVQYWGGRLAPIHDDDLLKLCEKLEQQMRDEIAELGVRAAGIRMNYFRKDGMCIPPHKDTTKYTLCLYESSPGLYMGGRFWHHYEPHKNKDGYLLLIGTRKEGAQKHFAKGPKGRLSIVSALV